MPHLSNRTPKSQMLVELTPHYSSEDWEESKCWEADSNSSGVGKDQKMWKNVGKCTPKASSLSPQLGNDGNVDRILYQNLVEMIPLVESFMDKNKAIARQASLVYTPTPARDVPWKKAVESPAKGRNNRKECPEEIPMQPLPLDAANNFVSKAEMLQLQSQIDQLEQKLHGKDNRFQPAETSLKQIDFLQMQVKLEELQKEMWEKERQIQNAHTQLMEKQREIADLQSLLKKAEADVSESNTKALTTEEELINLRCQVAALIFLFENMQAPSACGHTEEAHLAAENSTINIFPLKDRMQSGEQIITHRLDEIALEDIELVRRKYLAAIIAARENPGEELLSLVAELRAQLLNFLMQPPLMLTSLANDSIYSQISTLSLC